MGCVQQKIEARPQFQVLSVCAIPHASPLHTIGLVLKEHTVLCAAGSVTGISLSSSQDILSVIKTEGTKTEGIFIKPPDYKSFETLKGDLDSGRAVDIRNKSVHDVAWILKVGDILALFTLKIPLGLHE